MDEKEFLRGFFEGYCKPSHELSAKSFKKMCKDSGILDKNLTHVDCEILFEKVIAEVSTLDSGDPLHQCIIFGKRIEFPVFFMLLLPEVAELKQVSVQQIINKLQDCQIAKEAGSDVVQSTVSEGPVATEGEEPAPPA